MRLPAVIQNEHVHLSSHLALVREFSNVNRKLNSTRLNVVVEYAGLAEADDLIQYAGYVPSMNCSCVPSKSHGEGDERPVLTVAHMISRAVKLAD